MSPQKILFVASTGGHLSQLVRIASTLDVSPDSVWVTFHSPQSESLLAGRRIEFVPYVRPRDVIGVLRAARRIRRLLARESFDRVVTTGAAVALAALPLARLRRISADYIESVSRVRGPSLTGRIVAATRCARTWTQHAEWAHGRWRAHPSVFGTYHPGTRPRVERPRIFVTLGTIHGYRFDALIDAVLRTGLADDRTVWQLGETTRTALPGRSTRQLDSHEFEHEARQADVVIAHAGVGTVLDLFALGISPVVVPRRRARREHVDDHQEQIAELLARLDLAVVAEADTVTAEHLREASARAVAPAEVGR